MARKFESLDVMFDVWNSSDEDEQRRKIAAALEHNVHFVDPNHNIIGRDAFLKMVKRTQEQIPGASYVLASDIGFQNNFCRYHWRIEHQGKQLMTGFDVTEINDSGKIVKIIGFFGEITPLAA